MHRPQIVCLATVAIVLTAGSALAGQARGTLRVEVRSEGEPVVQAEVQVGTVTALTNAQGEAMLELPPGIVKVVVFRFGFGPRTARTTIEAGTTTRLSVELEHEVVVEEQVIVTATRTDRRIQDIPLRVEVVDRDEIEEKVLMTPGDIVMLLNEMGGLQVQVTSPSLGATSVRVQGLRGRYTQILADGLPLYGGQTGAIGLLQIPPMDLGQVEVIKGVASAFYGPSALGGVINLVSRRPHAHEHERELLVNRTSRGGTDGVAWLTGPLSERWGYTLLGGGHHQEAVDIDGDGWADLAGYGRALVRPRLFWDDGAGRSLLVTAGGMLESREGGTRPGATVPDGKPFVEALDTTRVDAGLVSRFLLPGGRLVSIRASAMGQGHRHRFGEVLERDHHATWFGEASLTGAGGDHTWVVGAVLQHDRYRARDLSAFDYRYTVPSLFVQDDYAVAPWLTFSGSARLDRHNVFGTFVSPRLSALVEPGAGWTLRVSGGTGYFAPTPLTEDTEVIGLSRLAPPGRLEAERGRSLSFDAGRHFGPVEINATVFGSVINDAVFLRQASGGPGRFELVNATEPTRTAGSEWLARYRRGPFIVFAIHTFVRSTEEDPGTTGRRDVPRTPRHSGWLVGMWEDHDRGRVGLEFFYTGRQSLDDNPFRHVGRPYPFLGALVEWRVGRRMRVFANAENLTGVRQTRFDPLVRPQRGLDGRWTVDAWAPLEGRIVNGGVRLGF